MMRIRPAVPVPEERLLPAMLMLHSERAFAVLYHLAGQALIPASNACM